MAAPPAARGARPQPGSRVARPAAQGARPAPHVQVAVGGVQQVPVPRPQCPERVLRFQDPATFTAKLSEYGIVVTLLARHGIQVLAERFVRGAPSLCACFSLRTSGMAEDARATNAWSELRVSVR